MAIKFEVLVSKEQAQQAWNEIIAKQSEGIQTAKGMSAALSEVNKKLSESKVGTDAFKELAIRAKQTEDELKRMQQQMIAATTSQKQYVSGTNQATQTLGQLGWALGDADMFMVNFHMGMMSIGNNIPMVAQGFMRLREEVKATGGSLKDALVSSIMGPGGVMLAINGLMFALNVLPKLFGDTTDKIKEQAKSVEELIGQYERLTKQQLISRQGDIQKELEQYTNELNDKYGRSKSFLGIKYNSIMPAGEMTEAEKVKYENLLNQNQALSEQIQKTGYLKDITNTLAMLEKKRSELPKDQLHAYDEQIKYYKKLKQEAEKSIDIKIDESKANDAKKKLEKLINAYVDELGQLKGFSFNFTSDQEEKEFKLQSDFIEKFKANAERQGLKWNNSLNEFAFYASLQLKKENVGLPVGLKDLKSLENFNPWSGIKGLSGTYDENIEALRKQAKEEAYLLDDVAKSFGEVLASEGKSAFEEMFGQANSLLEKFAISFGDKFINREADSIYNYLFDAFGVGSGGFLGLFSMRQAPSQSTIIVNVDGTEVARKIVNPQSVANAYKKAVQTRMITA